VSFAGQIAALPYKPKKADRSLADFWLSHWLELLASLIGLFSFYHNVNIF